MDKKKLLAGSTMVLLSAVAAQEAEAVTQAVPMRAEILTVINLSAAQSLNFGTFTYVSAGSVVIAATGGLTDNGGVTSIGGTGAAAGSLVITGAPNRVVDIAAPTSDTVAHVGTGGTMVVNGFNIITNANGNTGTINLGAGGTQTIPIGATLNIAGAEATGVYTGSFDVTVTYQ